jgi:hypothetical protein
MDDLTSLGDAIDDRVKDSSSIKQKINASQVVQASQKILQEKFGSGLVNQVKVKSWQKNTLEISCQSSVIAQEIKLQQDKIMENINKKLGKQKITNIKFSS